MDEKENPTAQAYLERRREQQRAYYEANKDKIREQKNEYRRTHGRTQAEFDANKRWRDRNKEYLAQKTKEWRESHPEAKKFYNSNYYKTHREKRIQQERDKRVEVDPNIAVVREKREFFRGRPWLRNLYWKWQEYIPWDKFKKLYPQLLDGPCDACGKTGEKMRVDHDHKTNKFRVLLCHSCNVSLGHFNDDPELIRKAIDYLQKGG